MKRALAVFLCLGIAFLPAISSAGAGTKIPGFDKSFLPPLPKPKLPAAMAKDQPVLDLTVTPKNQFPPLSKGGQGGFDKRQAASVSAASTAALSADTLPVASTDSSGNIIIGPGIKSITSSQDTMVITQNASRAIQNWQSFNIGSKGVVDFIQNSSSWICLNRISDLNPSQIFGEINAKGQIYLINQNGILFGPGSQVNVHTLIASSLSLNLSDTAFLSGNFTLTNGQPGMEFTLGSGNPNASVTNQGTIITDTLGSVFLLGPSVTNSGTIKTNTGQIGLAAGTDISLSYTGGSAQQTVDVLQAAGDTANIGTMTANTGLIGMYGASVDQNGVITAVAGLKNSAEIDLMASDIVFFGAGSITNAPISPSTDTADLSFGFHGGVINILGLNPFNSTQGVNEIVNRGLISAPSGTVNMTAQNRVYLETGSSIDVSGSWIDESASANVIDVQMNSVNLRDEPVQKNGILLGKHVYVNPLLGSSIGDISGALQAQSETALQRSLNGGSININSSGDLIVKQGATIDFSGGGIRYAAGDVPTTQLVSGNKVYDISDAPEDLIYDKIITTTTYMNSYVEGANAGTLTANAYHIVFDGQLQGSATAGVYQTSKSELYNSFGNQKTLGLAEPTGGALIIGNSGALGSLPLDRDFFLSSVVLSQNVTPLPPDFGPSDQPYVSPQPTILSTNILNAAGLSNLQIYANTTITIDAGAQVSLNPGGSFTAVSRQILNQGAISAPGGQVSLTLVDTVTSFEPISPSNPALVSQIILSGGSSIDVSGQQIDNSTLNGSAGTSDNFSFIGGGKVSLFDDTQSGTGIVMQQGASINVSGGYGINQNGKLTGGNAGSLSMQGSNIILQGNLAGYSLVGNNGGTIQLIAQTVEVAASSSQNSVGGQGLVLASHQLDGTGFTQIDLEAYNNVTFDQGAVLAPSLVKFALPTPGTTPSGNGLISVTEDLVGTSSIKAVAGVAPPLQGAANMNAQVNVGSGAVVEVYPGGTIGMSGPSVDIAGTLSAPAGQISLSTTVANLTLEATGQILALGYNKPAAEPVAVGLPVGYTPMSPGSVSLLASGDLILNAGSIVDVSGSNPQTTYVLNAAGVPIRTTVASAPGSISLYSSGDLQLNGVLKAMPQLSGLQGGTLSIDKTGAGALTITGSDIANYLSSGFDALTFGSSTALDLSGPMNCQIGRSLVLDSPVIEGSGAVNLSSPYIQLENASTGVSQNTAKGSGSLVLSADWIDVTGSIQFSGFQKMSLEATRDIRLFDYSYGSFWQGLLETPGDLTLQADRIYPAMDSANAGSAFTINSGGTVTILPSASPHNSSPIYSAGGDLTILAQGIDMEGGELAAPMGTISLSASGRVYLASGSTISTSGSISVDYGSLNDVFWTIVDKANVTDATGITVSAAPQKSVNITGGEVIMKSGSTIDISGSGGGGIFAYQFQAGIQGSFDPFQTAGRYVIVPNADYSLPGQAVYLAGAAGVPAGVYTLLPEQYAFLPGAMVITNTGVNVAPGTQKVSADGFPVVAGYFTYSGTSIQPPLMEAFEVQPASYLSKQGFFNTATFVAGDAGSVAINGNTTVLDGVILASALSGYQGGSISLSGTNAYIQASTVQLPSDFNFSTPVSDVQGLAGTLQVAADALSGKGFQVIDIGNLSTTGNLPITSTITVEQGSIINAASVVLSAQNGITLDSGAQINTIDSSGTGSASLITPNGLLTMQANSLVHASDLVTMTIGALDFDPKATLTIDHGALNLTGHNVYFVPSGSSQTSTSGLYLTSAFYSNFANFNDVTVSASGGSPDGSTQGVVWFPGATNSVPSSISLSAIKSFTINAAAIEWSNASDNGSVSITAPAISLLNRGGGTPLPPSLANAGSLTLNANEIFVGEGPSLNASMSVNSSINGFLIDGFATVNFNAVNDITFVGSGSLVTGAGILNLASGRITTSYYEDANTPYTAANFTVSAANAAVNVNPPQGGAAAPQATVTPGGTLEIDANSISVSGVIQMASGNLTLNGTNGVALGGSAQVLDTGSTETITVNGHNTYVCTPGGSVYLNSIKGSVTVGSNATVDVSGVPTDQSTDPNDLGVNAGLISIYSPTAAFNLQGTLNGAAGTRTVSGGPAGLGGSFSLDANSIGDFSSLYSKLGDFTGSLAIETRTGNLTINTNVTAYNVQLTADSGNLDVLGTIYASGAAGGGSVELNAGKNLTLESGAQIDACGLQGNSNGGTILLGSTSGTIDFQNGATLNVSGSGSGNGGSVYFRAPVNTAGNGVNNITNMTLDGVITGAKQILAEGFQVYAPLDGQTITSTDIGNCQTLIQTFMNNNASAIQSGLFSNLTLNGGSVGPNFVPGLEIDSTGSLTLNSAWNLSSWRFGPNSVPGMLTLRAGGDLIIDQNLTDAPTPYTSLTGLHGAASWGLNLIAGADLNSSNFMATVRGIGNLTIANGMMVYTESAPIRFASGNDTLIGEGSPNGLMIDPSIRYNLGSYSGTVQGDVGGNLTITGGAIQTATGDIDIAVGGDLVLGVATIFGYTPGQGPTALGAIRTTGRPTATLSEYWLYNNGGNITLKVAGAVQGALQTDAWDYDYQKTIMPSRVTTNNWSAQYVTPSASGYDATEGLATMAGGNLAVYAGGDFNSQIGTFGYGPGNLTVFAGGNLSGRFLVRNGVAELVTMGNFGNSGELQLIEAAPALPAYPANFAANTPALDVQINVTAQGGLYLGTVVNPTYAENNFSQAPNLGYSQTSSVSLTAVTGDVIISGDVPSVFTSVTSYTAGANSVLPATLHVTAGQDILITDNITLAPYADGSLSLVAGRDTDGQSTASATGRSQIFMSDADPALAYGVQENSWLSTTNHDPNVLHLNDTTGPVIISAGRDLENIDMVLPKEAEISAGRDILNIYYQGQNVAPSDVTTVTAGRNITFASTPEGNIADSGIQIIGPGYLVVQAGGSLDLGTTSGIQSLGDSYNPGLASLYTQGASVMVISGFTKDISFDDASAFFVQLQNQGTKFSDLLAEGDTADAQQVVQETRSSVIEPFIGNSATKGAGDINMTTSQISTLAGGDIYVFANGVLNVGQTAFVNAAQTQSTGIFTGFGGAINIFSEKDVNVNESRVMSFFGGNITMWSDTGDINAGRGSTTEIDASPPVLQDINGQPVLVFNPPSVGSGIRALTYDPGLGSPAPSAGNVLLVAPQGVIDAGQAGIAGNNVILGAPVVLNANNISFSGTSVGVPTAVSVGGLGAMTGTGSVTQGLQSQEAAIMNAAAGKLAQGDASSDAFSASWLEVRVLSFFNVDPGDGTWESTDN
ncbi:MAG: filamentous haemagglutinin family protein [Syntrophobacteraceae bacterium]